MRAGMLTIFACVAISAGWAEPALSIAGTVSFDEEGILYIHLVDEVQFAIPFTGIEEIKIELTPAQVELGRVDFAFSDIPHGRYGIRVYIDTNDNGELDRGLFGPKEPWGMSWQVKKLFKIPRFADISFDLTEDERGLEIDTR